MRMWIHTCLTCKHEQIQYKEYKELKCNKCDGKQQLSKSI